MPRIFKIAIACGVLAAVMLSAPHPAPAQMMMPKDEPEEMAIKPLGHFFIAASAHFTISTLCEKAWPEHPRACRFGSAGLVAAVAYWELSRFDGFNHEDFRADLAGIGFSLIILEW